MQERRTLEGNTLTWGILYLRDTWEWYFDLRITPFEWYLRFYCALSGTWELLELFAVLCVIIESPWRFWRCIIFHYPWLWLCVGLFSTYGRRMFPAASFLNINVGWNIMKFYECSKSHYRCIMALSVFDSNSKVLLATRIKFGWGLMQFEHKLHTFLRSLNPKCITPVCSFKSNCISCYAVWDETA
jgi:hypothetical protein